MVNYVDPMQCREVLLAALILCLSCWLMRSRCSLANLELLSEIGSQPETAYTWALKAAAQACQKLASKSEGFVSMTDNVLTLVVSAFTFVSSLLVTCHTVALVLFAASSLARACFMQQWWLCWVVLHS